MKKIIITLAALALTGNVVNAQVKNNKKNATKVTKEKMQVAAEKAVKTVTKDVTSIPTPPTPPAPPAPMAVPTPPVAGAVNAANGLPQTPAVAPVEYNFDEYAKVDKMEHDFGANVKQLPDGVSATFTVTNIGKEPLLIENVQASCGCTVPAWDKSPIAPGKTGSFTAKYNSQGRPGGFTKSLTIMTNRGRKAVTIKGTVEATPVAPTPAGTPAAGH
jgi:hypothetical protein